MTWTVSSTQGIRPFTYVIDFSSDSTQKITHDDEYIFET